MCNKERGRCDNKLRKMEFELSQIFCAAEFEGKHKFGCLANPGASEFGEKLTFVGAVNPSTHEIMKNRDFVLAKTSIAVEFEEKCNFGFASTDNFTPLSLSQDSFIR